MDTCQSSTLRGVDAKTERRPATQEEARALASPLRLRILRLCLDEARTNKELATQLDKDPGTLLHHVRTLVDNGFLAPDAERRGARGAREVPYRATGKSWRLDVGEGVAGSLVAMADAFSQELAATPPADVLILSRLGLRLSPERRDDLRARLEALGEEFHEPDDDGEPLALFLGLHRRR